MSDLSEKIADVINDHLKQEGGGMMTGFVLGVDYMDEEGDRQFLNVEAPGQHITDSLGILRWYTLTADEASLLAIRENLQP
jgi:hypothetical protein